jgi:transposase
VCFYVSEIYETAISIRLLTFKGLRASAIVAELQSVYETEVITLSTVKEWSKRFAEGRTSQSDDPTCEKPLANDLAEVISCMLKARPHH